MKTTALALAAVLALSGVAFADKAGDTGQPGANLQSTQATTAPSTTYTSKRFIDPTSTGSITVSPANEDRTNSNRVGGGIDPSVLPNF